MAAALQVLDYNKLDNFRVHENKNVVWFSSTDFPILMDIHQLEIMSCINLKEKLVRVVRMDITFGAWIKEIANDDEELICDIIRKCNMRDSMRLYCLHHRKKEFNNMTTESKDESTRGSVATEKHHDTSRILDFYPDDLKLRILRGE